MEPEPEDDSMRETDARWRTDLAEAQARVEELRGRRAAREGGEDAMVTEGLPVVERAGWLLQAMPRAVREHERRWVTLSGAALRTSEHELGTAVRERGHRSSTGVLLPSLWKSDMVHREVTPPEILAATHWEAGQLTVDGPRITWTVEQHSSPEQLQQVEPPGLPAEPPSGSCYKQKPTLRTWEKRFVRIQGRSLNFYANEDAETPRGSSIADVTGCVVTTPPVSFALSRSNWFKIELSRADLMGAGTTSFCFADESLRDIFATSLRNLSEGREWNADDGHSMLSRSASASLVGCIARTPKSGRKGWPNVLRIDLAKPDTSGERKYIIALETAEDLVAWKETLHLASTIDESSGTLSGRATLAEIDLGQCVAIRRLVDRDDAGHITTSRLDFEVCTSTNAMRFRGHTEDETNDWLAALRSADHTLRQLSAAKARAAQRQQLQTAARETALAALQAEAALLELDVAPKTPFHLCQGCLRVGVRGQFDGSCAVCRVVPVPAESVCPRDRLRGACFACMEDAAELGESTAGVVFSCGHWLCLQDVNAKSIDIAGSCFVQWARAQLENNPDVELSLAPYRPHSRRAQQQVGPHTADRGTQYTLRCQHCAHGRLHTAELLSLLGDTVYSQFQQLCADARAQEAEDAAGEGTDLLGRNVSLTLSQGSGHIVVVIEEWERRPMLDFRRDPSAAETNYYSKATLLPTDPPPWASPDGAPCAREEPRLLLPGWRWESEWRAVADSRTDGEGWAYSFGLGDFGWKPTHIESSPGIKPWQVTFVRKRRWERMVAPPPVGSVFAYTKELLSRPLPAQPTRPGTATGCFETSFQVAMRRQPRLQDSDSPRCAVCTSTFHLSARRHYCGSCGESVCIKCWNDCVVDVLQWEWVRICSRCFGDLAQDVQRCHEAGVDLTPGCKVHSIPEAADTLAPPTLDSWEILTEPEPEPEAENPPVVADGTVRLTALGAVEVQHSKWIQDGASKTCMLPDCGLTFSTFTNTRSRHHCRHCGLLCCSSCFAADVKSAVDGEGWLRICADCAVHIAGQVVQSPSVDVESVATQIHTMLQHVERRRAVERASEEQSFMNVAKRNMKVMVEQRAEESAEFWRDWVAGGNVKALLKSTTKPCVKCNVPIEKNGGCLHMTCTQCRHEWWWCCGADYRLGHAQACKHSGMSHYGN